MEDKNGYYYRGSGLWRSLRDGDFEESDMWDVLDDKKNHSPKTHCTTEPSGSYSSQSPIHSAAKMIPRASSGSGSGSSSGSTPEPKIIQQSAPVNVPNWSHIKRRNAKSKKASWRGNDGNGDDEADDNDVHYAGESDGDEDENDYKMPPHEFIASRLARSHISSFSVCEGVGRTLKGRDLSKVRNAVLTKTGFLESL